MDRVSEVPTRKHRPNARALRDLQLDGRPVGTRAGKDCAEQDLRNVNVWRIPVASRPSGRAERATRIALPVAATVDDVIRADIHWVRNVDDPVGIAGQAFRLTCVEGESV